jgi:hypothetical protein
MTVQIFEKVKQALIKKYEAQADAARANIEVYQNNMVGVGEHAIMTETIEAEYKKLDDATSMLETLKNN